MPENERSEIDGSETNTAMPENERSEIDGSGRAL